MANAKGRVREQMKNPQTRQVTEALIDGHEFHAALYAYGGIWCKRNLDVFFSRVPIVEAWPFAKVSVMHATGGVIKSG
jgi:hypothetical protein